MAMKPISVAIVGDDRGLQKTFDGVTRRMATLSTSGERFSAGIRKIGDDTGITRLATGFQSLHGRVAGAAESLGRFAPALAGLASVGTVAGIAQLVNTWTSFGARLGLDASRIGLTAQRLHGLQGAARLAGSSAETLTDGMETLGGNLVDAAGGRNTAVVQMLSTLGVGFRNASTGGARLAQDVLPEIADRISKIRDPFLRARAATTLFGGAGRDLLPFIERGSAGIRELTALSERYGLVNDRGVAGARDMARAQMQMGLAAEGVGYAISERVAPILVPMLDRLSDWVASHREQIAGFFGDVATRIERWVDSGGINRVTTAVTEFGTRIAGIVDSVGGATNALGIFFGLWVGAKVLGALAAMAQVTAALRGIGAAQAAAGMAAPGVGATAGGGLLVGAARVATAGYVAHEVTKAFDPNDAFGDWMDRHFPGASFVDNLFSRYGLGRSYAEQRRVSAALGTGAPGTATTDYTPRERNGAMMARSVPLPAGETAARARYAFDRYVSQGDTPQVAAGRVANLVTESGMNDRNDTGDGGTAYGLGQWHGDRRRAFRAMYGHEMRDGTRDEQIDFFRRDPDVGAQRANQLIARPGTSAGAAAAQISRLNERPADESGDMQRRAALAETLLKQYTAAPAPVVAPVPAPVAGAGAAGANGTATVRLEHVNPPPGLRTSVQTAGDLQYGGLRIERPQLGSMP